MNKVQESCFRSINSIFILFKDPFFKIVDKLIIKIIQFLQDKRESISSLALTLFTDSILASYLIKDTINSLIKIYHELPSSSSQLKCLELIRIALSGNKSNKQIVFSPMMVKFLFPKLTYIFNQNQNKKKLCETVSEILKILLRQNYQASIESFYHTP